MMSPFFPRSAAGYVLSALLALSVGLAGCGSGDRDGAGRAGIGSVREVVVRFATETGEWITENAATAAEALRKIWERLREPFSGGERELVRIDSDDPLRGRMRGKCMIKVIVVDEGRRSTIELDLVNPRVRRSSVESEDWKLDPRDPDVPRSWRHVLENESTGNAP